MKRIADGIRQTRAERDSELKRRLPLFVSPSLSVSLCAVTEIALRSLYSSACEPCVLLRGLAEASVHWAVQLRGLRALTKLPSARLRGAGCSELEATVPVAVIVKMQSHSSWDALSNVM